MHELTYRPPPERQGQSGPRARPPAAAIARNPPEVGMNSFTESLQAAGMLIGQADPKLWHVVALSLGVSATAAALAAVLGLLAGACLAVTRFPGQRALLLVINTLLALPSVVVGLTVYLLLSRSGPL